MKEAAMALVKMRERGEITLPREIQEALALRAGDDLEALVVEVVAAAEREAAWRRVQDLQRSVRPTSEQAAKPVEVQEQEILEVVDEVRREHAKERGRR
jgi:bifunctional DNA-binding transcriptional regulator/antitoxin component of YhaV-PrlF toxin-antitoxin module